MDEKLMTLPVIALRGLTVLPEMIQHFDISRDKSISAVEHAMVGEQKVFLVTQRQIEEEDPDASGLFQIGTIARIKQLVKIPGGLVRVMVEGLERAELINLLQDDPYLEARGGRSASDGRKPERYCKGGHGPHRQGEAGRVWKRQSQDGQGLHGWAYGHYGSERAADPDGRSVPLGVYGEAGAFGVRLCEPSV